jgi:hypothetical protein
MLIKASSTSRSHREKTLKRIGRLAWLACLILTAISGVLFAQNRQVLVDPDIIGISFGLILSLGYSSVGLLLIMYRPRLPLGWLLMALALPSALTSFMQMVAVYGFLIRDSTDSVFIQLMAWVQIWAIYLAFPGPVALLLMLFPDGRLPSKRWRWAGGAVVITTLVLVLSEMFNPGAVQIYVAEEAVALPMQNPTGIAGLDRLSAIQGLAWLGASLMLPVGIAALVVRYRKSLGIERQQLKVFVYFAFVALAFVPLVGLDNELFAAFAVGVVLAILPLGITISVFRFRLFDIDIIIRRTLKYALLTGLLASVYFSGVVVFQGMLGPLTGGSNSPFITVITTLAIIALFNPLRTRIQNFIDRRFYRRKYDAEQTLGRFAATARDEVDLDRLAAALLGVTGDTLQPETVSLWLGPARRQRADKE